MTCPSETLAMEFLEASYAAESRLTASSRKSYAAAIRSLSVFLERPATLADLNDDTLREYAQYQLARGVAKVTTKAIVSKLRPMGRFSRGERRKRLAEQPPIAEIKRAALMFAEGASFVDIAEELGVSEWTLRIWRNRDFKGMWKAGVEEASQSLIQLMRQEIGDAVVADPASYLKLLPNGAAIVETLDLVSAVQDGRLDAIVEEMLLERAVASQTAGQYRRGVQTYSAFLGQPATTEHLNYQQVNQWLRSLEACKAPRTVRTRWRAICAVWNYTAETRGIDPPHSKRIRRCKLPPPQPTVWTDAELSALIATTHLMHAPIHGVSTGALLRALIHVDYCTALRRSDLMAVRFSQLHPDGAIVTHQTKTNQLVLHWLDEAALRSIQAIRKPERDRIFPVSKSWLSRRWRQLLEKAGLPSGYREGPQKLRRTSATAVAVEHGMDAAGRHLGHLTPGLAAKHYVPLLAAAKRHMPRPLPAPKHLLAPSEQKREAQQEDVA